MNGGDRSLLGYRAAHVRHSAAVPPLLLLDDSRVVGQKKSVSQSAGNEDAVSRFLTIGIALSRILVVLNGDVICPLGVAIMRRIS